MRTSGQVDEDGDGFSDAFDGQQFTWHVVGVEDPADLASEYLAELGLL